MKPEKADIFPIFLLHKRLISILFLWIIILPCMLFAAEPLPDLDVIQNLFYQGSVEQADQLLDKWIAADPNKEKIPFLLLLSAQKRSLPSSSTARYQELLRRYPSSQTSIDGALELAKCYLLLGDVESAEGALKPLFNLDASDDRRFEAFFLSGRIKERKNNDPGALQDYKIAKDSGDPVLSAEAWVGVGDCSSRLGQEEKAKEAYLKAIEISPEKLDLGKVYLELAKIERTSGRLSDARRYLNILTKRMTYSAYYKNGLELVQEIEDTQRIMERGSLAMLPVIPGRLTVRVRNIVNRDQAMEIVELWSRAGVTAEILPEGAAFTVRCTGLADMSEAVRLVNLLQKQMNLTAEIVRIR